ncbi:peptide chain release factor 2 [Salicibibacter halophilus]|uniref:Peptide chain release factor 2 n=1 Tax=Salicibibacter halophilus TaxID=2502791 RepID=A0A514LJ17_9BACI|nr:peptide chain release factor 2 [Salicibibacter halophilus]QDI91849.1 peptide chain release factor 2 [Salicibibacter halophilus]
MDSAEIKTEFTTMANRLAEFRGSLDLEAKESRIKELEEEMTFPGFWDNPDASKEVIDETNALKETAHTFRELEEELENLKVTQELLQEEEDEELREDLEQGIRSLSEKINQFELKMLLSDPHDEKDAILEIHPGAGGTESQDWAQMLLRMYTRWAEKRKFKVEKLNYLPGDEAGLKSVTLLIKGQDAYGHLKAEKGVHRLVRISPFDSSGRRHTSFASCEVMPEMDEDVNIEVAAEDLKIDTYRASGAGGQHVNTTDSAVRITHIPTNTVVQCQNERSQIKNREHAMKMLRARLYQQELERQQQELDELRGNQSEIGWGSQIRSYVFHPYNMVKDHRTNYEVGNSEAVMDGAIDVFIDAYLRSRIT